MENYTRLKMTTPTVVLKWDARRLPYFEWRDSGSSIPFPIQGLLLYTINNIHQYM
jgi:hypothetical protein